MTRLTLASILALLATTTFAVADERPPAAKLEGTWSWSAGADGTLEAIFTATGVERWNVDFHFEFDGRPRTYSGTAEGPRRRPTESLATRPWCGAVAATAERPCPVVARMDSHGAA